MNLSPVFVAFVLMLLAILIIASIATTILGWIAVSQIRRSHGKLWGLGLAVFEGLLFPLLAVDAVVIRLLVTTSASNPFISHLVILLLGNGLIFWAVWRGVQLPGSNPPPRPADAAAPVPAQKTPEAGAAGGTVRSSRRGCLIAAAIVAGGALLLLVAAIAALFIYRLFLVTNQSEASKQRVMYVEREKMRSAQISRTQPAMSFGPVIELTLPMNANGVSEPLPGLDPEEAATAPPPKTRLTVIHDAAQNDTSLGGTGGNSYLGKLPNKWATMTADETAATAARHSGSTGITTSTVRRRNPPHVFVFRTPAGRAGLLEITDFPPGAVKLRYKLVQDAAAKASAPSPVVPTFGPVIERVIEPSNRDRFALNLASGDFITSGPGQLPDLSKADLFSSQMTSGTVVGVLTALDMRACYSCTPVKPGDFENLTAAQLEQVLEQMKNWRENMQASQIFGLTLRNSSTAVTKDSLYIFVTREGVKGALQIYDDPRGMKVRYKLVQNGETKTAAQTATFGPVIERTIQDMESVQDDALCLETGKLLSLPSGLSKAETQQWLRDNSIDLMCDSGEHFWLIAFAMVFGDLPDAAWETASVPEIDLACDAGTSRLEKGNRQFGWTSFQFRPGSALPATFAFRQATGLRGLLQIIGPTENPPGVKLRYKLVSPP